MKQQPDNTADEQSVPQVAIEPDAKDVLSDREIAEMLSAHLGDCNRMVKMFRPSDFHQKVCETSVHRSRCGRKVLVTSEYDCSITVLELINEH